MSGQESLELKGRAPDPVIEECKAHPRRIIEIVFEEHSGVLWGELVNPSTREPSGIKTPISYDAWRLSRRADAST